ncbi:uncharacterized protein [Euphorbia lathyris]|uniref:uncharacterized protein n=1 Tax=Euphorbia lathyris TaxID=212925 RepID=UPI00331376B7
MCKAEILSQKSSAATKPNLLLHPKNAAQPQQHDSRTQEKRRALHAAATSFTPPSFAAAAGILLRRRRLIHTLPHFLGNNNFVVNSMWKMELHQLGCLTGIQMMMLESSSVEVRVHINVFSNS